MGGQHKFSLFLYLGGWFPDKEEIEMERTVFRYTCLQIKVLYLTSSHISQRVMTSSDILNEIKRIAKEVPPKGGQLILYGSRARNEATEDSDWDLLILLDKPKIEHGDYDNVLYPFAALSWDVGEQISPIIYTKNEWNKYSFTPFYKNVEQDGIVLA